MHRYNGEFCTPSVSYKNNTQRSNDIGRYYTLYSKKNTNPEKLGRKVVKMIPKQPKAYASEFKVQTFATKLRQHYL